jgi:anti-sigma regulatory factor (Ser/Thr protein kinase)
MDDATEFELPRILDAQTAPRLVTEWADLPPGAELGSIRTPEGFACSPSGATLLASLTAAAGRAPLEDVPTPRLWLVDTERAASDAASQARSVLRDQGVPGSLTRPATLLLEEIAVNVAQHSRRPETGFASVACFDDEFEVSVCDAGVGIRRSLQEAGEGRDLATDGEAIRLALHEGVSAGDPRENAGLGLPWLVNLADKVRAEVRIWSGEAMWRYRDHVASCTEDCAELSGVWISVIVPLAPASSE